MDGPQPPRRLTPNSCACDSPWLSLVPERARSRPFCPRVGISLHHPNLSPSALNLPVLIRLNPSQPTLLPSFETKSRSLSLALSLLVRLSDRPYRSEASRIHHRLHLPEQASTSAPASLLLSLSHTSWAAPIARCAPRSETRPTNLSTDLVGSERLRLLESSPERQPSQYHLPSSNLLRSTRPLPALQSSATIRFPPTRASTRTTWRLRSLT